MTMYVQIDPARVALGEDIDENAQNLTDFCGLFLNAITGSLKHCPRYASPACVRSSGVGSSF